MKAIVYEIWTLHRVIEADTWEELCDKSAPERPDPQSLSLSNWHLIDLDDVTIETKPSLKPLIAVK